MRVCCTNLLLLLTPPPPSPLPPLPRDLKRDISKKLEKLERRTQRAIVELISKPHPPTSSQTVWLLLPILPSLRGAAPG